MKRFLLALALVFIAAPAYAATCPQSTYQIKDNLGNTGNVVYTDDGGGAGNCIPDVHLDPAQLNSNVTPAEGAANTAGSPVQSQGAVFNGTTWDRQKETQGTTGAAPPAAADYLGANSSGATGGKLQGLIVCDHHVFKHITSATDTLAVQGVASQTIRVCGALGNGAGAATWALENTASANANCSSSNTQITGLATAASASASGFYNPIWGGLANTSGNGLCIVSTGTGGVDVDIWYTQF